MKNLKPCPFCGGEAVIITSWDPYIERDSTKVVCKSCRANSGIWIQKQKAIETWNRRIDDGQTGRNFEIGLKNGSRSKSTTFISIGKKNIKTTREGKYEGAGETGKNN